jgi:hypothetical protein
MGATLIPRGAVWAGMRPVLGACAEAANLPAGVRRLIRESSVTEQY